MKSKLVGIVAAMAAVFLLPITASAHHISGSIVVNCDQGTVSVTVASWTGNVEIVKKPVGPVTEKLPASQNATVVFSIASIGGNGNYTAGRQNNPTDPVPVAFTVECSVPTSSPSPSPTPSSTPTSTPTPTPTGTPTSTPSSTPTAPGVPSVPDTGASSPSDNLPVLWVGLGLIVLAVGLSVGSLVLASVRKRRE